MLRLGIVPDLTLTLMMVFLMIQVISYLRMAELPCMKIKYEVHDHNEQLTGWVGA